MFFSQPVNTQILRHKAIYFLILLYPLKHNPENFSVRRWSCICINTHNPPPPPPLPFHHTAAASLSLLSPNTLCLIIWGDYSLLLLLLLSPLNIVRGRLKKAERDAPADLSMLYMCSEIQSSSFHPSFSFSAVHSLSRAAWSSTDPRRGPWRPGSPATSPSE